MSIMKNLVETLDNIEESIKLMVYFVENTEERLGKLESKVSMLVQLSNDMNEDWELNNE